MMRPRLDGRLAENDEQRGQRGGYGRAALIVTYTAAVGYAGGWAVPLDSLLFALYHVWMPWRLVSLTLGTCSDGEYDRLRNRPAAYVAAAGVARHGCVRILVQFKLATIFLLHHRPFDRVRGADDQRPLLRAREQAIVDPSGILFSVIYATIISFNYMLQLIAVGPSIAKHHLRARSHESGDAVKAEAGCGLGKPAPR